MNQNPPRSRRRWSLIILFVLACIALLCFGIFKTFSRVNAITPEQINAPPTLYTMLAENTTGTAAEKMLTTKPNYYEDFIAANPNQTAVTIYKKWYEVVGKSRTPIYTAILHKWKPGQPLSPEQVKWLLDHRELIDDLIKLAEAGGIPIMTGKQISGWDFGQYISMPMPNYTFMRSASLILAAECARRCETKDVTDSIRAVLAIYPLSLSIVEPAQIGHLIAMEMQNYADLQIADMLAHNAINPEQARMIRDRIAAEGLTLAHYHRSVELYYFFERKFLMQTISGSFKDLFRVNMMHQVCRTRHTNEFFETCSRISSGVTRLTEAAVQSVGMKANASEEIKHFDGRVSELLHSIDSNEIGKQYIEDDYFYDITPALMLVRINLAHQRVDLVALDDDTTTDSSNRFDPFSNKPLRIVNETSSTLIYSIGPDLKDQSATITYDPTNGTNSPGDIILRIPRRPEP